MNMASLKRLHQSVCQTRKCSTILAKRIFGNIKLQRNMSVAETNFNQKEPVEPLDHPDYFNVSKLFSLKELFDARVHLGHHEGTWNALTAPYIYGLRATQHVINLDKTVECLKCALNVLSHVVYKKGTILFMSTNPKYDYVIQKSARKCGEYFITRGWKQGTFTSCNKMLGADKLPDLIIAFNNSRFERMREAILEAAMCNIPVIGIVDSDCDPRLITYPIPGNDDSIESVQFFLKVFEQAILKAKERHIADEENDDSGEHDENADKQNVANSS